MTDIIRLLPDSVANQIAAGEVVQRPASVVKELLENAIDADATDIHLVIKDAGRKLIQVIDNGKGMSSADARMSFERHATSKISNANDLFALNTKGFRGEALASIAAVAQVELRTQPTDEELGTRLIIEGSEVKLHEEDVCTTGTSIAVKNLFFNVPARRNFLKSNAVEQKHILEELHRVALVHPTINFKLTINDRDNYQLASSALRQRIVSIFGKNYNERLVPIEEKTDIVTISGFICKPEYARKTRGEQYFFVNNRFIKHPYLHHAVMNAYKEMIAPDQFPSYFVYLTVPTDKIDINIHPTKTEVKFEDEKPIYAMLLSAVRSSLGKFNIASTLDFDKEPQFDVQFSPDKEIVPPKVDLDPTYNPFEQQGSKKSSSAVRANWNQTTAFPEKEVIELQQELYKPAPELDQHENSERKEEHIRPAAVHSESGVPVFQLQRKFLVTHVNSGLIVLHQQRAHERILYEQFMYSLQEQKTSSQRLMFPLETPLNEEEKILLESVLPELGQLGFDASIEGGRLIVQAVHSAIEKFNLDAFIEATLEQIKHGNDEFKEKTHHLLATSLAQSQSIRSGRKLTIEEMNNLLDTLFACQHPAVSPSGLPVIVTFTADELDQRFKL